MFTFAVWRDISEQLQSIKIEVEVYKKLRRGGEIELRRIFNDTEKIAHEIGSEKKTNKKLFNPY